MFLAFWRKDILNKKVCGGEQMLSISQTQHKQLIPHSRLGVTSNSFKQATVYPSPRLLVDMVLTQLFPTCKVPPLMKRLHNEPHSRLEPNGQLNFGVRVPPSSRVWSGIPQSKSWSAEHSVIDSGSLAFFLSFLYADPALQGGQGDLCRRITRIPSYAALAWLARRQYNGRGCHKW
jgi:hypothetical protein